MLRGGDFVLRYNRIVGVGSRTKDGMVGLLNSRNRAPVRETRKRCVDLYGSLPEVVTSRYCRDVFELD